MNLSNCNDHCHQNLWLIFVWRSVQIIVINRSHVYNESWIIVSFKLQDSISFTKIFMISKDWPFLFLILLGFSCLLILKWIQIKELNAMMPWDFTTGNVSCHNVSDTSIFMCGHHRFKVDFGCVPLSLCLLTSLART